MKPRRRRNLNIFQRTQLAVADFIAKNAIGDDFGNSIPLFNNTGGRPISADFGRTTMDDKTLYVGYMYAAIRNRFVATSQLATDHLMTRWKAPDKTDDHPYLAIIDNSPDFTNNFFWQALSAFLDLKGVAYLLAVRNFDDTRVGDIQQLKILNPFSITKLKNQTTGEILFIETKDGLQRKIPAQQMIQIKTLNPFKLDEGFAMADAAKEDQFLNQQANSYTRNAIHNNVGQRGLLTSEVLLDNETFENFKAAVESQAGSSGAGQFLYGNGPGALSYVDMQIDLDKLALDKINSISLERLLAATGMSRTSFGIEQSGVTRDTARVQDDRLTRDHIIPQVQTILDALNQDYRNHYQIEYNSQRPELFIDSPLKTDREAELSDATIQKTKAQTAQILIMTGFDPSAVLEAVGIEDLAYIGPPQATTPTANMLLDKAHNDHEHDETDAIYSTNDLSPSLRAVVAGKQSTLQTDINNVQRRVVQSVVKHLTESKNDLSQTQQDDIISQQERDQHEQELAAVLATFFTMMIPLFANQTIRQRLKQFGLPSSFKMAADIKTWIAEHSAAAAASHTDTILEEIYKVANELGKTGASRQQIISKIANTYNETISRQQAARIARTESNRSVAEAQYRADHQFIKQNELAGRAFKRWVTRSGNPCRYCQALEQQTAAHPIPFGDNFVDKNSSVDVTETNADGSTTSRSYKASYESVGSGTLHPNCSCIYELVIK